MGVLEFTSLISGKTGGAPAKWFWSSESASLNLPETYILDIVIYKNLKIEHFVFMTADWIHWSELENICWNLVHSIHLKKFIELWWNSCNRF